MCINKFKFPADITNNQEKSQTFVYLVQIKNEYDIAVSLTWFSGQLTPNQKLSPSLSWTPDREGRIHCRNLCMGRFHKP